MLFDNYRRIKRISKHLVRGSVLFSAPVLIAGVCGVIGLAAFIYLKKRADGNTGKGFCGFTHAKHSDAGRKRSAHSKKEAQTDYTEDDFIVVESEEEPKSKKADSKAEKKTGGTQTGVWIASAASKIFHKPDCSRVSRISEANRTELTGSEASLIKKGYKPCASCIGK